MPKRIQVIIAIALTFLSLAAQAGHAQTPQTSSADEAAIRQIVQQLQDGWNAHDGKAFAAPFAADADYVVINGTKIKGKEAIEEGHTGIFTTVYKDSHNVGTVKGLRFLRPDVAVVHVEWALEVRTGDKVEKARATNSKVMTKAGGKWAISAFQNTPMRTAER
ncbi:MAG: SgcJ/EcaC family oxidoreductase [Acidobacteriota bacterium]